MASTFKPTRVVNTSRSKDYFARAQHSLALGVSSGMRASALPCPIYVDRGFGPRFLDVDGNEFVDHCLAWGPLILGHAHPAINESVRQQLERGYTYGAQCELEFQVAEKLQEIVPCGERVLFSNTGTEAVQSALRIARSATGRTKVIKFEGHYHGWVDSLLVSYKPDMQQAGAADMPNSVPSSSGQDPAAYVNTVVLPWNDEKTVERYLNEHPGEVAAIITEPILFNNGCIYPVPGFLESLRRLASDHHVVLIFDEVITGFRVHMGGAQALFGVTPDIAVFAKAIAGGFPLSVVAGKESLIREVDRGRVVHAGTFNGNPIVLSAALTTLEIIAKDNGAALVKAKEFGEAVIAILLGLADEYQLPLDVLGHGTAFRPVIGATGSIQNYRDFLQADEEANRALRVELFNSGIYCVGDGRWYVSVVHRKKELEYLQEKLPETLKAFAHNYFKNVPRQKRMGKSSGRIRR